MKRVLDDLKTEKEVDDAIELLKRHKRKLQNDKRQATIHRLVVKNPDFEKELKSWRDIVADAVGVFNVDGAQYIVQSVHAHESVKMSYLTPGGGRSYDFTVHKNGSTTAGCTFKWSEMDRVLVFAKFLIEHFHE